MHRTILEKSKTKKDYTENGLHSSKTTHYTEKKLYREKLFGKRDYTEDGVGLHGEGLHRKGLNYIKGELQREETK